MLEQSRFNEYDRNHFARSDEANHTTLEKRLGIVTLKHGGSMEKKSMSGSKAEPKVNNNQLNTYSEKKLENKGKYQKPSQVSNREDRDYSGPKRKR